MSDEKLCINDPNNHECGSHPDGIVTDELNHERTTQAFDPKLEDAYWRATYANRFPHESNHTYEDDYAVAYYIGYQGRNRHKDSYAEHEKDLAIEWERIKGESRLTWDQAKAAMREAWNRVEHQMSGKGSPNDTDRNDVINGEPGSLAVGTEVDVVGSTVVGEGGTETASPPAKDDAYWRDRYTSRPAYVSGYSYEDDYAVAYRLGYEGRNFCKTPFEDNEEDLKSDWERHKGNSRLTWDQAKAAMREAWDRIESEMPVNADQRNEH